MLDNKVKHNSFYYYNIIIKKHFLTVFDILNINRKNNEKIKIKSV